MFHKFRDKKPRQLTIIAVSLAVLVLITAAVGTRAWLSTRRTLQTITKVQYYTLKLIGETDATLPVNLGEINFKNESSKEIKFGVLSKSGTEYLLQLGHTTNLPLTYKIYHLTGENGETRTEITGKYLNKNNTTNLAETEGKYHSATYKSSDPVQKNAEPLYWVSNSGQCVCEASGTDMYILEISWNPTDISNITDKETEMIYLTAGLGGY